MSKSVQVVEPEQDSEGILDASRGILLAIVLGVSAYALCAGVAWLVSFVAGVYEREIPPAPDAMWSTSNPSVGRILK